jgi:hypothetical protein
MRALQNFTPKLALHRIEDELLMDLEQLCGSISERAPVLDRLNGYKFKALTFSDNRRDSPLVLSRRRLIFAIWVVGTSSPVEL